MTLLVILAFYLWQVDMLSEINIAPRILTNFTGVMPPQFKKDLDSYLKTRSPVTFLSDLRSNLQVNWFGLKLSYVFHRKHFLCMVLCVVHLGVSLLLSFPSVGWGSLDLCILLVHFISDILLQLWTRQPYKSRPQTVISCWYFQGFSEYVDADLHFSVGYFESYIFTICICHATTTFSPNL